MRVIKKYATRRMYDVKNSRFITLEKIADLIATGEEVRVINDKTGDDITPTVLAQIILEQQRSRQNLSSVPGLLRKLIKKGTGSVLDFLERPVLGPIELFSLTEEKVKKIIKKLVKKGEVSRVESDNLIRGLLTKVRKSKKALETFVKETIAGMNIPSRVEFERLKSEIKKLKGQIAAISDN